MLKRLRSILRALTSRRDFEAGMTEELRFHMEQYADDLVRSGVSREEADRRAVMEFGGINSVKGECRESRGLHPFDELGRELSHAFRWLRKTPGFTATALITLALCLGANLTIFAVIDSILVRPLPFPEAGRLVTMFNTYPKAGVDRDGSSLTNYYERRGRIPAFRSLSMYEYGTAIIGEPGSTMREQITQVSPEFFTTLGISPAIGRAFTEEETTPGTKRVVILTDTYWRRNLNADSHILGRLIRVEGFTNTVVGVLPPGFRFLSSESRLYFPLASSPESHAASQRHSGGNSRQIVARLGPGATLAQAQSQIDAQNTALEADDPEAKMMADAGFRTLVVPLHADLVAAVRPTLLLLQAGALLLLLIGAVNLVNLLLIRAGGRTKELAVRQALGASARNIAGEAVVETTLLTFVGGLLGLAAGAGGIRLLAALGADRLPLGTYIAFNARLALAALVAAALLGVALAAPIVWFNLRSRLGNALQSESRGATSGRAAQTLRHSFIVAQIALSFVLLAGSGLLGLSLKRVMSVSPGFRSDHVLTGQISLPGKDYQSSDARLAFIERLMDKLAHQPGVLSAGVVNNVPLSGRSGKSAAWVQGHILRPGESPRGSYSYGVGGDYFHAMGFSLLAGRFLTGADSRRAERVCVVDEDFARYYWHNQSPLGHRLFQGSGPAPDAEAFTVVGVVGNVKQAELADDTAQGAVYYPYAFRPEDHIYMAIGASLPPESLGLTLQKVVRQMDASMPVTDLRTMETRISDSLATRRSPALLAAIFSGIALLLTAIGTYGVLSYAVAQRKREIGVRMALGARPEQIRSQFLSIALRLLLGGTLLGVAGAWLTGYAMRTVLFHTPAFNPATLIAAAAVMVAVCLAACLLPARRAARVSPMQAMLE
jgi:predicted permease